MHISILPYLLCSIFMLIIGAIGTIFWSLDPAGFNEAQANIDLSDAILTTLILGLVAAISKKA